MNFFNYNSVATSVRGYYFNKTPECDDTKTLRVARIAKTITSLIDYEKSSLNDLQDRIEEAVENEMNPEEIYRSLISDTSVERVIEAACLILDLLATLDIKITAQALVILNLAPPEFSEVYHTEGPEEFILEVLKAICYTEEEEEEILDYLKLWEEHPQDTTLSKKIESFFPKVESLEDLQLQTVQGFENYLIEKRMIPVLVAFASWLKDISGLSLADCVGLWLTIKNN